MYVQVALLSATDKDGLNARRLVEVIQLNEGSEFLSYFPQWVKLYTLVPPSIIWSLRVLRLPLCSG